jgi:GH25 family lysozyme M1 (1,4-beta-N-acetylmuramidase)
MPARLTESLSGFRRKIGAGVLVGAVALGAVAGATVLPGEASAATVVRGMDVSGYQGNVDWSTAYANGARFAYVKATEGTTYTNPSFAQQYNGSYNVGMIRGAYHFAHPDSSGGATQADYFIAHGGGWSADGKTLPPALDIEYNPSGAECYGLSQASMVSWIRAFSNEVKARENKYPMIYTTFDWWNTCTGNSSAFASTNPFWIAIYRSTPPTSLPAGTSTWTIWQNADSGTFPGDQDQFNGAYSQLQALATNHD